MARNIDYDSLAEYLEEAYVSKYAKYLNDEEDDDDYDDDEDDDEDEKSSSSKKDTKDKKHDEEKKEASSTPVFLSTEDINKARNVVAIILNKYAKLKKCCDYIDIRDKDHINDDGERESELGRYYHSGDPKSFIALIDGDVFSGYPNFRSGGNESFEKDSKAFCKEVNEMLEDKGIKAKFCSGPGKEDEAVSFGLRSLKTK